MQVTSVTRKSNSETWHQKQLIQWTRQYPWGQFLYHIPNETTGGQGWIVRNRQMGCKKGVPDLCLPIPMCGYHGLYIEMKTEKGKLSLEQKRWLQMLNEAGYYAVECRGWEEARKVLERYTNGRITSIT